MYVLLLIFNVMYTARILHVQFWCIDPDWEGGATEQTDIVLFP